MVSFPVLNELSITGFGLYPGRPGNHSGLNIRFESGLTLILGANGLGKTTLITILYRLLTGPFDLPALAVRGDLGYASLQVSALAPTAKTIFAQRVTDGAKNAIARLQLTIGKTPVLIERRLRDLALLRFAVDGKELKGDENSVYQREIARLVGVWSFADWILLLRHIVFYFEDRRALVWDPSAQRQLLRFLLLPVATAKKWTEDEREILELDSRMRNLRFAAYREEQALGDIELKIEKGAQVREQLRALESVQAVDVQEREKRDATIVEIEGQRSHARLRHLQAEQERESRYRECGWLCYLMPLKRPASLL